MFGGGGQRQEALLLTIESSSLGDQALKLSPEKVMLDVWAVDHQQILGKQMGGWGSNISTGIVQPEKGDFVVDPRASDVREWNEEAVCDFLKANRFSDEFRAYCRKNAIDGATLLHARDTVYSLMANELPLGHVVRFSHACTFLRHRKSHYKVLADFGDAHAPIVLNLISMFGQTFRRVLFCAGATTYEMRDAVLFHVESAGDSWNSKVNSSFMLGFQSKRLLVHRSRSPHQPAVDPLNEVQLGTPFAQKGIFQTQLDRAFGTETGPAEFSTELERITLLLPENRIIRTSGLGKGQIMSPTHYILYSEADRKAFFVLLCMRRFSKDHPISRFDLHLLRFLFSRIAESVPALPVKVEMETGKPLLPQVGPKPKTGGLAFDFAGGNPNNGGTGFAFGAPSEDD
jgi:hypothetical protein